MGVFGKFFTSLISKGLVIRMADHDFERDLRIHEEALRRMEKEKEQERRNQIESMKIAGAVYLKYFAKDERVRDAAAGYISGVIIGGLSLVAMLVTFVIGCLHEMGWLFTLSCAVFIVAYTWRFHKSTPLIVIGVDIVVILAWAFMRFLVMPTSW